MFYQLFNVCFHKQVRLHIMVKRIQTAFRQYLKPNYNLVKIIQ